jgi:outer membrane protein assembly factor BamB
VQRPASRPARPGGRARWLTAAIGVVVALTGLAALVLARSFPPQDPSAPRSGPGAEEVALPAPGELPNHGGSGGEDGADEPPDQAQPADAAVPPTLRCGDDDCERWWRPFLRGPVYSVWRDADQVLHVADDRLVAWDAATGADRWERPLPTDVARGPDHLGGGSWRPPQIIGRDGYLALLGTGGVQGLTGSGEVRWTAVLEGEVPMIATMTGELLVVLTQGDEPGSDGPETSDEPTDVAGANEPADPDEPVEPVEAPPDVQEPRLAIAAFDLETGELRWRRGDLPMLVSNWFHHAAAAEVLLVQDRAAAVALDAAAGTERYRLDDAAVGEGFAGELSHVGSFLITTRLAASGGGWDAVIHAAEDGRELIVLADQVVDAALVVDDLLIAVAHPGPNQDGVDDRTRREAEALAVDLAGTIVWRVPIDSVASASCCASVLDGGDGTVRVAAGPGADASHLDVRTGRVERIGRVTGTMQREEWPFGRDLLLSHTSGGRETTLWMARGGPPVTALGGFVQPVLGAGGLATADDLLLLRTETGLVAVEVPPVNEG